MTTIITASGIEKALAERFCGPEWAFFPQLRNGTGYGQSRTADAVAMGLYPSRGLPLWGFEIKVSRSDLTRELADPDKAEDIAQYCDAWWIVAPKGLAKPDELPVTWGLIEVSDKAKIRKQAQRMEPKPLPRSFVASIMRKVQTTTVPKDFVDARVRKEVAVEREKWNREERWEVERLKGQIATFRKLEELSGVRVSDWNVDRLAAVLKVAGDSHVDPEYHIRRLEDVERSAANIQVFLKHQIESLRTATESLEQDPAPA